MPARACWKRVPIMTGKTTSPGKNCAAITAPAEMLRMPTQNHEVTILEVGLLRTSASPMPSAKPHAAKTRMNAATSTSSGVR